MGFIRFLAWFVLLVVLASAQNSVAQSNIDPITIEQIDDRISVIGADADIDDPSKREALEVFNRARETLSLRRRRAVEVERFETSARNLDQSLADIEARRLELETTPGERGDDRTAGELEARLSLLEAERQSSMDHLSELRTDNLNLNGRATAIADEVVAARNDVAQLSETNDLVPDRPEAPVEEARWLLARARLLERQAAIVDLQKELETLPARQSLMAARISLTEAEIAQVDDTLLQLRARLSASALGRAEIAIRAAEADLIAMEGASPDVLALAEGNLDLAIETHAGILRRAALERLILETEREAAAVNQSAETVRLVLGAGRLSDETSTLLKTVRDSLPDESEINAVLFRSERERGDIQLRLIVWVEALRAADFSSPVQMAGANDRNRGPLLEFRRSMLEWLVKDARLESELMSKHELSLVELSHQSSALSKLLDRSLLWLRTSQRANWAWLDQIPRGIAWVLSPSNWAGASETLLSGISGNSRIAGLFVLGLLALLGLRRRLIGMLDRLATQVGHVGRDTYWTTPLALSVTMLLALPVPLSITVAGGLLSNSGTEPPTFSQGLAQTLILLGPILFVLFLFLNMCRPSGLFAAHFNWTEKARTRLHANLGWFARLESGAICLFGLTVFSAPPGIAYGIGVAAFVVASVALAVLTFQFLRPKGGIVSQLKTGPTTSLMLKLLLPVAVAEPLFVGALPFFGFFETAMQLQYMVLQSGALVLGGSVLYGLAVRMFMVGNRRFALAKAREKWARIKAARAVEDEIEASGETIGQDLDASIADAEDISEQIRSVLRVSAFGTVAVLLWVLWSPLIPALGAADEISLWTHSVTSNGTELREAVTLLDLLVVALFLAAAIFAVRNIGGLLEVGVFEPFGFDAASRYASVSITRYILVATAVVLGLSRLGANWSELQWVIAALGVGLGFGLQEIVANFVSGLIILFERPIRVGDVVTIGDLRGTVRNIRIRATTITDFDSRQVILPNKTIITENVTNWTLEDDVTRLLLRVGVAYGSDIETVQTIILDCVKAHPDVLTKPPPTVFLMAHGDSALQFEVRLFVSKPVKRLPTTHALNAAINTALNDNGIRIPFPQTDVHVSMADQAGETDGADFNEAALEGPVRAQNARVRSARTGPE